MDEFEAAKLVADTLTWAANQASVPALDLSIRDDEIRFKDRITGDIFSITVRRVYR